MLFSSEAFMSKMQRFITGSRFGTYNIDHVAMILKLKDESILLLEATGSEGVTLTSWIDFNNQKWYSKFRRVVYRPLIIPRGDDLIEKMEKLVKEVIGMKYNMSLIKIFTMNFLLESPANIKDKPGFFCSELIASIYKELDLLPKDLSSSKYWPGDY